jgi:hypothetical protein
MRRLTTFSATLLAALALPALAQASTGTVLSLTQKHHLVQIISSNKAVHAYSFTGKLAGVTRGTNLSYSVAGTRITHARAVGVAHSFSFFGTVVTSHGGGLVLALADSRHLRLSSRQLGGQQLGKTHPGVRAHAGDARSITVNINGLTPGQTVEVTESIDSSGNLTVTITLPSAGGTGSGGELSASGTVNNVNDDSFDIITSDGSDLNFHMAAGALANVGMSSCDEVVVTYHQDAQMMIADNVVDNGPPDTGVCSGNGSGEGGDWIGTVTAVSATSITVDAGADSGGSQTFTAGDPSVTVGFLVGDSVDVSYEQDGAQWVADDVSYNDTPTSDVLTAIADAGNGYDKLTMVDDYTNQSETFYAPTDLLDGQGVQIGDDLSVSYYQAAAGLTLDYLEDDGASDS